MLLAGLPAHGLIWHLSTVFKNIQGKHTGTVSDGFLDRLPDQLANPVLAYWQPDGRLAVLLEDGPAPVLVVIVPDSPLPGGRMGNAIATVHRRDRKESVTERLREALQDRRLAYIHKEKGRRWLPLPPHMPSQARPRGGQDDPTANMATNEDLDKQQSAEDGPRGSYRPPAGGIGGGTSLLSLFQSADLSTFLHESGHLWLDELIEFATMDGSPRQLIDDLDTVLDWMGLEVRAADTDSADA